MTVSIILPCYNPLKDWAETIINEYKQLVPKFNDDTIEIVVVRDGPSKNVLDTDIDLLKNNIANFQFVPYEVNHGKGYAIREGMKVAKGDILIYTDIDMPYTQESMLSVYKRLRVNQTPIVAGIKDESYYAHVPFLRRLISKGLRKMIKFFLSLPFTDTQCGLKGFQAAVKPVFLATTINRYLFDLEFIRHAYNKGYKIDAIPIKLKEGINFTKVNYKMLLPEAMNFLRIIFNKEA